jgi:hypothetical protein
MNPYIGLLLQKGHITDPQLVLLLSRSVTEPAPEAAPKPGIWRSRVRWLLEEMKLLGGRPLPRDRFDDIDEPFPTLHGCS